MQRLEVSGAVRPIYGPLGFKRLSEKCLYLQLNCSETITVLIHNHKLLFILSFLVKSSS